MSLASNMTGSLNFFFLSKITPYLSYMLNGPTVLLANKITNFEWRKYNLTVFNILITDLFSS